MYDVMKSQEGDGSQVVLRVSEGGGMVVPGFRPWHLVGAFSSKVGVLPQIAEGGGIKCS